MIKKIIQQNWIYLFFLLLGLCLMLFPNNNPTIDAWAYATDVKYDGELFWSHHLLYNWCFFIILKIPFFQTFDTLKFMQFSNGVFALLSLLILYQILLKINKNKVAAIAWTFLVGCSFACLRFGTENETYIIPIFFSLLSSLFFCNIDKNQQRSRDVFLSGFFAAFACLFHQVQFFWWLGILIGVCIQSKKIKKIILFLLPAFIVPAIYIFVLVLVNKTPLSIPNLLNFVFEYYYGNDAEISIGLTNLLLTPISFIRSFVQVHGNIVNFFLSKPILSSIAILLALWCCFKTFFPVKYSFSIKNGKNIFTDTHFIIFILQLFFAFCSNGNAEFMVMLPFLLPIFIITRLQIDTQRIIYLAFAMLIWNMTFAILPNHFYNFQNNEKIVKIIHQNRDKTFVLQEDIKIKAQYEYLTGIDVSNIVISSTDSILSKSNSLIYTDILTKKTPLDRSSMLQKKVDFNYIFVKHVAEIPAFYGNYYIDEIRIK